MPVEDERAYSSRSTVSVDDTLTDEATGTAKQWKYVELP
jgi:hypothetical protein